MYAKLSTTVLGSLLVLAMVAPAQGADAFQTIDATLGASVAISSSPSDVSGWALVVGSNTRSGGGLTVNANTAYALTVVAEQATLSEYDGSDYVTDGAALNLPLAITPTRASGTAAVPAVAVPADAGTTSAGLATGLGGGTDVFSLQFAQTVLPADAPLTDGNTYHNRLTYTASAAL